MALSPHTQPVLTKGCVHPRGEVHLMGTLIGNLSADLDSPWVTEGPKFISNKCPLASVDGLLADSSDLGGPLNEPSAS